MASMLAAEGERCAAVVLFGYPLHPAGRPERLRIAHLPAVGAPMLFLSGTRDRLARMELLEPVVAGLPGATLEVIEGADHSFEVTRADGRAREEVLDDLVGRAVRWLEAISPARGAGSSPAGAGDAPRR